MSKRYRVFIEVLIGYDVDEVEDADDAMEYVKNLSDDDYVAYEYVYTTKVVRAVEIDADGKPIPHPADRAGAETEAT